MQVLREKYRPYIDGEKIEALFMFQAGTVWASMDSVYRSCILDERFDVKLALIEETTVESSHMIGAREYLEKENINYCMYEELDFNSYCPHIVFIQFPYDVACHTPETLSLQFKRRGSRVIYIPYGIEISDTELARKDHFSSFVVENAWRIYTCCEGIKEEYEKYCRNRKAVRVCGSPKFDGVANKHLFTIENSLFKKINGKKIIVWKMHFPKKINENGAIKQITPDIQEYIKFAKELDNYKDLFFIVLAHPKMLKGVVASDVQGDDSLMKQVNQLIDVLENKENVVIDASDEYRNSLYNADAIIMDRSGVLVEATMLDVPILFMTNKKYTEKMTVPVQNIVDSFIQGTTYKNMMDFINDFQNGVDVMAAKRRYSLKSNFPLADGDCGKRIKFDITESLQEKTDKPRVVLYGTGEICGYYMEKQKWAENSKFNLVAVSDSNRMKWGTMYYGVPVISLEKLKQIDFDAIVITTEPHYFEIKKSLVYEYYLDERKIWRLDEFIVQLDCE